MEQELLHTCSNSMLAGWKDGGRSLVGIRPTNHTAAFTLMPLTRSISDPISLAVESSQDKEEAGESKPSARVCVLITSQLAVSSSELS